jgi:hypothetical protein
MYIFLYLVAAPLILLPFAAIFPLMDYFGKSSTVVYGVSLILAISPSLYWWSKRDPELQDIGYYVFRKKGRTSRPENET